MLKYVANNGLCASANNGIYQKKNCGFAENMNGRNWRYCKSK